MTASHGKVPVVLLCAPSGTGLTRISDWLNDDVRIVVADLERAVCEIHRNPAKQETPRMGRVTRDPRPVLYDSWRIACTRVFDEVVEKASTAKPPLPAVVSMHLTWYNPDTSEFFSPVDLIALSNSKCSIVHVVILIDDIFDMYKNLTGSEDLYGDQFNKHHQRMLKNFAPQLSEEDQQAQVTEIALNELLSWRRAEMIQAENMARTLRARLTVLGTKHHRQALKSIVSTPNLPRIYLSHRISEHRRHNMDGNEWLPVVYEVNTLHQHFVDQDQVLINPTAIDELRYEKADNQGQRDPILGDRWPIPEFSHLMLCSLPLRDSEGRVDTDATKRRDAEVDYEHKRILTNNSETIPVVSRSVARYLANRVSFEIGFRDHVIVENTPNLCVYRPFFCVDLNEAATKSKWSSGVRREIQHWDTSQRRVVRNLPQDIPQVQQDKRRIAFIHTKTEIDGRMDWLFTESNIKKFVRSVDMLLSKVWEEDGMSTKEMTALFANQIPSEPEADPLGRDPKKFRVEEDPKGVFESIGAVIQSVLHQEFTSLVRPGMIDIDTGGPAAYGVDQILLRVIDEKEKDRSAEKLPELTGDLSEFFLADELTEEQAGDLNSDFWAYCQECLDSRAQIGFDRFIAAKLNLPYDELELLGG